MRFEALLRRIADEPVFETSLLCAGDVDPSDIERQLSRWKQTGKLIQLRRGLYTVPSPYRRAPAHPFVVANALVRPSYVSFESALAHHGLIPEHVAVTTSATTRRPARFDTPLGAQRFHHVKVDFFWGFDQTPLSSADSDRAFVATPEKALLDLFHLRPGSDSPAFIAELRLQNLDRLDLPALRAMAARAKSPKLTRAAAIVERLARSEAEEYETL